MSRALAWAGGLLPLVLTACGADKRDFWTSERWDVEAAAALPVPDDPMLQSLRETYLEHARFEADEPDWGSVVDYILRLRTLSAGSLPPIRDLEEMGLDDAALLELGPVRAQILALQASPGARLRASPEIGAAQAHFDCWAEQAGEGHQVDDIARCRAATLDAVARAKAAAQLPANWVVLLPEEGDIGGVSVSDGKRELLLSEANAAARADGEVAYMPVDVSEVSETFGAAQAASPLPPRLFTLTFETGQTEIDTAGFEAIAAASADVKRRNDAGAAAEIVVTGHADAVGPARANLTLSRRRAAVVAAAVSNELSHEPGVRFRTEARGERDLLVDTIDSDVQNRRVTILVR
ncbi:MAG: OmpA family protein [Pseudomonadota bacterium]